MRSHKQVALIISIVALVPIMPFLAAGWWLEPWITEQLSHGSQATASGLFVVAALAADIFLPIPSSAVCAWAGQRFGVTVGTACCWLGLTLGAVAGYALARYGGRAVAVRLADRETMTRLDQLSNWGAWMLVLTRPIPLFAEAAVLLMGINRFAWLPFLLVICASNLAVAVVFVGAGQMASAGGWFPLAIVAVVAFPALAAVLARRILKGSSEKLRNQDCRHNQQDNNHGSCGQHG